MKGIDCSQVVAGAFAEELGITQEEAYKMAAGIWRRNGNRRDLRCSSRCNDRFWE